MSRFYHRDFTSRMTPTVLGLQPGIATTVSLLFPSPMGDTVTNDWCISDTLSICLDNVTNEFLSVQMCISVLLKK